MKAHDEAMYRLSIQLYSLYQYFLRWIIGAAVVNAFYSHNRNQIGKSTIIKGTFCKDTDKCNNDDDELTSNTKFC